ncbi:MAG TPA: UDP-N-acetylglucosamine 2-epimerase, partial [Beutenbergiaceae bacterium]|nr:UDP-N-acetylglucosamine 2-epimerase [Beutenbergiaceae bacterium]
SEPHVEEFMVKGDPVIVATAHRRENWGQGLRNIARATARIADLHPRARIVFPLHPNPQVQETLKQEIAARPNVLLTGPLDYQDFTAVLKRAAVVITDSGGIQEEAPSLGAHVFVTRDETERIEGAEAGVLTIVGTDVGNIVWAVSQYLASSIRHSELVNPYGDGRSAARIIDFLDRRLTAHSNSEGVEVVPARPSAAGTVQG